MMIDTLVAMRERIEASDAPETHGLPRGEYLVVTLHRPALVDGPLLADAIGQLAALSAELSVVFRVHPRHTRHARDTGDRLWHRAAPVLYGLVCLATIPAAGPAIRALFGDEFEGATSLYYWLLPGIYSLGMLTILSHHFAGRGFPRQALMIWFVGLALNLALDFAFLPGRGAWVAALASSVAYAVLLVLHMWLFAREAGGFGAMRPRPGEVIRFVRVAFSRG